MEAERKILANIIKVTNTSTEEKQYLFEVLNDIPKNPKSAKASEEARKRGNAVLLQQKNHDAQMHKAILDYYCQSIAFAPNESEVQALAFGNRSYFLLHIKKYEDSIKDIDRALEITNSDVLKVKLLCRKAHCLKKLGCVEFSSVLEIAESLIDDIKGEDKNKLVQILDSVKILDVNNTKEAQKSKNQNGKAKEVPITEDYLSRVSIQYNKKYGRHLLATKDYKPGDIVFVEKIYVTAAKEKSDLLVCDYCSMSTWSSIPCNFCTWSMYCSKSCKEKAWKEYHDMECPTISHIKNHCRIGWKHLILSTRLLIKSLKETGSITCLKNELNTVDQCKDDTLKGFFKDGQLNINSFRNIYSLASFMNSEFKEVAELVVPLMLISLSKYSKLKDIFIIEKIDDLWIDEDIVFLGALLIRILAVSNSNGLEILVDEQSASRKSTEIALFAERCCMCALFSLLNHSCFPTAAWLYTHPNRMLVYALQPIKKNSQIFIPYIDTCDEQTYLNRQAFYLEKYNFICDCQICVEEWPPFIRDNDDSHPLKLGSLEIDVQRDRRNGKYDPTKLLKIIQHFREGQIDESHVKDMSKLIIQGKNWRQPSIMYYSLTLYLRNILSTIYSPKALLFSNCV